MPTLKLIGSYTSPYVRKIRIMLAEKNIPYELFWTMFGARSRKFCHLIPSDKYRVFYCPRVKY